MKFKKVFKYFDAFLDYRIFTINAATKEEELVYEGNAFDIPWSLLDSELVKKKNIGEDYEGAIFIDVKTNKHGVNVPAVDVYVLE